MRRSMQQIMPLGESTISNTTTAITRAYQLLKDTPLWVMPWQRLEERFSTQFAIGVRKIQLHGLLKLETHGEQLAISRITLNQ